MGYCAAFFYDTIASVGRLLLDDRVVVFESLLHRLGVLGTFVFVVAGPVHVALVQEVVRHLGDEVVRAVEDHVFSRPALDERLHVRHLLRVEFELAAHEEVIDCLMCRAQCRQSILLVVVPGVHDREHPNEPEEGLHGVVVVREGTILDRVSLDHPADPLGGDVVDRECLDSCRQRHGSSIAQDLADDSRDVVEAGSGSPHLLVHAEDPRVPIVGARVALGFDPVLGSEAMRTTFAHPELRGPTRHFTSLHLDRRQFGGGRVDGFVRSRRARRGEHEQKNKKGKVLHIDRFLTCGFRNGTGSLGKCLFLLSRVLKTKRHSLYEERYNIPESCYFVKADIV